MQDIKHLYWRAGFGLSPQEWRERKDWTIKRSVDHLFDEAGEAGLLTAPVLTEADPRAMDEAEKAEKLRQERQQVAQINADWLQRMGDTRQPALLERMTLFWHGHFACRILFGKLTASYLNALRTHALGNFRELVPAVARDPAMIRYLNNQQNRKQRPKENFARELLELFTMGRGNYSEQDIKEAARAFTGWSSNLAGEFTFIPFQHDFGTKTFLGKSGPFNCGKRNISNEKKRLSQKFRFRLHCFDGAIVPEHPGKRRPALPGRFPAHLRYHS